MDWTLEIAFHWPHDRFAFGWDIMRPDEQYDYYTFKAVSYTHLRAHETLRLSRMPSSA